ncbi:hypothetical protein TNCV_3502681 [Trichonephila clavipes]|uniref:Uncharacterized protein n=1 Tax=Trichonephila clavipes TaxID=2585209 RepID=A0A8X6RV54_TRICX|nr:hypothetical protein TNCV_3502681 [Trichonephila clavipes]
MKYGLWLEFQSRGRLKRGKGNRIMAMKIYVQKDHRDIYGIRQIVRVQYFVRGGSVGHRSRASSKHLSPSSSGRRARFLGGQKGVALHLQMHVWVSGPQRKPTRC